MSEPRPTSAPAKVCIRCGRDCSMRPRTKDLHGRYTCQECLEAARRHRPAQQQQQQQQPDPVVAAASPAPEEPEDGLMSALLSQAPPVMAAPAVAPCPECGHPVPAASVVCTHCGFDKRAGRSLATRRAAEEIPDPDSPDFRTNRPDHELAEAARLARIEYIKAIGIAAAALIGVCVFVSTQTNRHPMTVPSYLGLYGISVAAAVATYALCCLIRFGFDSSFLLITARMAAIVAAVDVARIPLMGWPPADLMAWLGPTPWLIPIFLYIMLLNQLTELDLGSSIIAGICLAAVQLVLGYAFVAALGP